MKNFFGDDFDYIRLERHRDVYLDIARADNLLPKKLNDVKTYFGSLHRNEEKIFNLISEFVFFVRVLLTVPATTYSAGRPFSIMRILKYYLRSTCNQDRLDWLVIIYIDGSLLGNMDFAVIIDKFISKNCQRLATFALSKHMLKK